LKLEEVRILRLREADRAEQKAEENRRMAEQAEGGEKEERRDHCKNAAIAATTRELWRRLMIL